MKIQRLSQASLQTILDGETTEEATCVIKFYSNGCHYCHKLKDLYEKISDTFPDVYFFAFNITDNPSVQKRLKFKGVPTILVVNVHEGPSKPDIKLLPEPTAPSKITWYTAENIKTFITKEKQ
jgi:thiol-disulfide isomerase/thioredoxin|tara:strand:- start:2470 stop:2838 length:369 start_codon:yes stop_codon:yes gene_type:complete